jgi:protocatechuate 3,4-dioxygenase beta subunit
MSLARRVAAVAAIACLHVCAPAYAQVGPLEIERGVAWLTAQVQADGSLQDEAASLAASLQARSEAATALRLSGVVPAALVDAIAGHPDDDTEALARRIDAVKAAGRDASSLLAQLKARQNPDGGFGPDAEHDSTIIDTAFALDALAIADPAAVGIASGAVGFLVSRQAADGGFHHSSALSDHYTTVLAMHALWRHRGVFALADPIGKARLFVLASKGAGGVWHSTELTALALIAILPTQTTAAGLTDSVDALKAAQRPDGSFDGDPYTTALALRALAMAFAPSTNPDLATLAGRVVDDAGAPLEGATVSITGKEARTLTTDATGTFTFDKLVAGSYELIVARAGFGGIKGTITLQLGQSSNLGDLVLLPVVSPTTATVRGVITDAANGAPLASATIVAGGRTATSNTLGAYEVTGITPGDISISVTRSGYFAALASATAAAGQTIIFSPALVRTTTSTTTIKGKVTDKATNAPIASATVRLTGANTRTVTTDNQGNYSMTTLAPGPTQIEVLRTGYATVKASLDVELNVTYDFSPALEAIPPTGVNPRLSGRVTDALTDAAIGVATITLGGANSGTARGDGNGYYRFTDLQVGRTLVSFSAPGYQPVVVPITLAFSTEHSLSMALYPDGYIDPNGAITGRAVDEVNLLAVAAAVVSAELDADTRLFTVAGEDGRFSIAGGLEGVWKVTIGRSGYQDFTTEVLIPANGKVNLGDVRLKRQAAAAKLPDLIVSLIDRTRVANDPLTFLAAGQVDVQVSNIGNAAPAQSSRVLVYIDRDRDGRFDPAKDEVIGSARLTTLIEPRAFATVTLDIAGTLPFRDAPFRVRVDADDELVELNEINNEASSADVGVCK